MLRQRGFTLLGVIVFALVLCVVFLGALAWVNDVGPLPEKLNDPDSNTNEAYVGLREEFYRQLSLLDTLGYFENQAAGAPVCGCGCFGTSTRDCYETLGSLLPDAARALVASNLLNSCVASIVIVSPEEVVPLEYQWSKMGAAGQQFEPELYSWPTEGPITRWEDGRGYSNLPYLLVGVTGAEFCRISGAPSDSAETPCDRAQSCLTLTEATALLTMFPHIPESIGCTVAAGSFSNSYSVETFPFLFELTDPPSEIYRLDIYLPEVQARWPRPMWAPQCVQRLTYE